MLSLENVLFMDTEHNINTYQPESIQTLYKGETRIFTTFDKHDQEALTRMWNEAEAVMFWNACFDAGKLSSMFDNSFRWKTDKDGLSAYWRLEIFGNRYNVRRIGGFRNLIKPLNRVKTKEERKAKKKGTTSTPIIDLLKLWSILIEDNEEFVSLKLKDVLKRYGYENEERKVIDFTPENSLTDAYRNQDVEGLKYLAQLFLDKVENVLDLRKYAWFTWGDIKSPATFTKRAYEQRYPMKLWKEANDLTVSRDDKLKYALEQAYKGGITLSMHRGKIENTAWVDIKSAYANTIKHFNTDRFLLFDFEKHEGCDWDFKKTNCLLKVRHNFCIESMNKSLKMFAVEEPATRWVWYDDIQASINFFPAYEYEVLGGYEFIPLNHCRTSLVEEWVKAKEEPGLKQRNKTLYDYYKFLSNTSYGIKAQRKPFETKHTNMVIAGMITANVHRILSIINKTIQEFGYTPKYNDTDSSNFAQHKVFTDDDMISVVSKINANIYPYEVESEGFNKTTTLLSLKRYLSEGGENLQGLKNEDKVRLHGKGRYNIKEADTREYIKTRKLPDKELQITNLAGNTERTLRQVLKLRPQFAQYQHPFMFILNIQTDRSMQDFMVKWFCHMDTKTTKPEGDISADDEFSREFITFDNMAVASNYFGVYVEEEKADDISNNFRDWDAELEEDFDLQD